MRELISVAKLNFKEAIRDKFFWGVVFFFVFYLSFCIFLSKLSVGHSDKVLRNAGLIGIELSAVVLIIFAFTLSFYRDKSSRMTQIYLTHFRRRDYLNGKIIGFFVLAMAYLLLAALAYVSILYLFGAFHPAVLPALYPLFLKIAIVIGYASLFSSIFSSSLLALLSSSFIYLASIFAVSAFNIINVYGTSWQKTALGMIYALLPNMDKLDIRPLVVWGDLPPYDFFFSLTLYSSAYVLTLWLANFVIFNSKEY